MTVSFQNPWMLLLLAALPLTIWLSYRSAFKQEPGRRWLALAIRMVILLFLILALSQVQIVRRHDKLTVLFVMDVSRSIESGSEKSILEFINKAGREKPREDRIGLVVFGSEPSVEELPREVFDKTQIMSYVGKDATDIGAAIRLANAIFPEDSARRMVLITDGNENRGSSLDETRAAVLQGTTIDVLPRRYQRQKDVVLEEVIVPSQVQEGETFEARVVVRSDEEGEATIHMYRDGQYLTSQKLNLVRGKKVITLQQQLKGSGFHSFEAKIESSQDRFPDNNRGGAISYIEGKSRVLVLEGDRQKGGYLARALSGENFVVDVLGAEHIPLMTAAEWQNYDAVILSDLGADNLTYAQMQMIESNVRDLGMGLAMVGGENSFGAGGYLGTPIENALPVNMDITQNRVLPNGAIVFIVDHIPCIGDGWTKEICIGTLRGISNWDLMGLIYRSRDSRDEQWLFELQRPTDKASLEAMIQRMYPGSMNAMERSFTMARDSLIPGKAGYKHIVVITNGLATPPSAALVKSIRERKISMSVAIIEPWHGRQEHLKEYEEMVKGSGGNFKVIQPGENAKVPEFFIKEAKMMKKGLYFEEKFTPEFQYDTEILAGIGPKEFPQLAGYNATANKPNTEVPLVSDHGDPVLAQWRYGLGKSVAFTSDAKNRWAATWLGWEKFGKFWSQTAKWILRTVPKSSYRMSIQHGKTASKVVVDATDADGKYVNFLKVAGTLVDPEMNPRALAFRQIGPGRYEAEFRADQGGIYMVNVRHQEGNGPEKVLRRGFSVPYALEYRDDHHNEDLLKSLAEVGRGRMVDHKTDLFDRTGLPMTDSPQNLWPLLLTVALLLFPFDVFVRRVMLEWLQVIVWFRRMVAKIPGLSRLNPQTAPAIDPLMAALHRKRLGLKESVTAYQATLPEGAADLPVVGTGTEEKKPIPGATAPKPSAAPEPQTHIQRLLKAKGRAFKNDS